MKKLLENKLVVGGVCIVIAAILAFLVLPGMYKQKEKDDYDMPIAVGYYGRDKD